MKLATIRTQTCVTQYAHMHIRARMNAIINTHFAFKTRKRSDFTTHTIKTSPTVIAPSDVPSYVNFEFERVALAPWIEQVSR